MQTNSLSPYGAQKYIGEVYMKLYSEIYGIETVSLRYFNVYGLRQSSSGAYASVIAKFIDFKKNSKAMTITGDGEQTRSFVHVSDVVKANINAMRSDNVGKGEVVNIGTNEMHSVNQIAKLLGGKFVYIDPRIEIRATLADIKKAKELLDWEPNIKLGDALIDFKKYHNMN